MGFWRNLFGGDADSSKPNPDFPFTLSRVAGRSAIQALSSLRKEGVNDGFSPLLVGDDEGIERLNEQQEMNAASVEEYLSEAAKVDPIWWLRKVVELDPEQFELPIGSWPNDATPSMTILSHLDMKTGRPKPSVYVARIPTTRTWEIPAYLRFGNWNECPDAHYHVAMAKSWHDRFGAELVVATHDTLEFEVTRPPQTRDAAMALAKEHFTYCNDIVHQGVGTLENLAASVLGARYWFFWWD